MQLLLHSTEVYPLKKYLTDKGTMAKIKITQVRSRIRRPQDQKRTLDALGLSKINQSVEVEETPQIAGMVKKVNHLVTVEKV